MRRLPRLSGGSATVLAFAGVRLWRLVLCDGGSIIPVLLKWQDLHFGQQLRQLSNNVWDEGFVQSNDPEVLRQEGWVS